jgi:radical SAM protein with 4Fe4S-binding SPASM domain
MLCIVYIKQKLIFVKNLILQFVPENIKIPSILKLSTLINIFRAKITQIYHLKKFLILFKKNNKKNLRFPLLFQIQTVNRCNTSCQMCPYESTTANEKYNLMDDKLFQKIIDEISYYKESELIVLSLQNEPLADKTIINKAKYIKSITPTIKLELVSNGYLLTPSIADDIYDVFDIVTLSIHAISSSTYKKVLGGLDFKTTFENLKYINKSRKKKHKTVLRFVKQKNNSHEYKQFKKYWSRNGFAVLGFDLNSRLKAIKNFENMRHRTNFLQKLKLQILEKISPLIMPSCPIPGISMYIRSNGDVIYCFNDWGNNNVAGNLKNSNILEIYNSKEMIDFRTRVKEKSCNKDDICTNCDLYNDGIYLTI